MTDRDNQDRVVVGVVDSGLDPAAAIASVADAASGGTALFVGTVRRDAAVEQNAAKSVTRLEYEAHRPLAEQKLQEIGSTAADRWGLQRVVALHRTGTCELGEPTVVVACSAAHRAEALDACRWIIDQIKKDVPIWKQEIYDDGSAWVESS
jgi:molybdopterin synthase catalytic subunit